MQLHVVSVLVMLCALCSTTATAEARVVMRNADSCGPSCWTTTIDFVIEDEPVAGGVHMTLSGQKKIDPPDKLGGFVLLWGCIRADGSEPSLEATYRVKPHSADTPKPRAANCENYRVLGTWGMSPHDHGVLIPQEIHDREVTFSGDFTCDADLGQWFTADHVWIKRHFTYCVPLGLSDIYYIRGEARRADEGSGLGQINFAKICEQGSKSGGPTMQMRTQVKGATFQGEPVSLDNVPIMISNTLPDFCVLVGRDSEGIVLSSGYRLNTIGYAEPHVGWLSWLSQRLNAPR